MMLIHGLQVCQAVLLLFDKLCLFILYGWKLSGRSSYGLCNV